MIDALTGHSISWSDLPENKPQQWLHPDYPVGVIVLKREDKVSVWHNLCPHQARPLNYAPGQYLQTPDGHMVCAAHGATFDLDNGECIAGPCKGSSLQGVDIEQIDDRIHLVAK